MNELESQLQTTKAETIKHVEELKAEKEKEVAEYRADLAERKKMINYYEKFMETERHQILHDIEELKGLTELEK